MQDLRYKLIMALNAADLGSPICEQAAGICAEVAEQHCAQLNHVTSALAGEIAELAGGEPALAWSPSPAHTSRGAS